MAREIWRRPSLVVVSWSIVLLLAFVVSGDLRIDAKTEPDVGRRVLRNEQPVNEQPVIVRPERASRLPAVRTSLRKGRVFDAMGFLVVGAEVTTTDRAAERTDADGEFRLELPEDRLTHVLVRAKGQRSVWFCTAAVSPGPLVVQLAPRAPWDEEPSPLPTIEAPMRGEGLVRTADGTPVVGAFVTAMGGEFWSRTDEFGRYVLPLTSKTATLLVHHPDGGPEQRGLAARLDDVAMSRSQGVVPLPEVVAEVAGTIRGTVRDGHGLPVAGVPVEVRGEGFRRVFETGIGGIFRLAGLLPGRYQVIPFAFRGAIGQAQDIALDRSVVDCDLHLQNAEERRLRVLDERGSPVGGAFVAASVAGQRRSMTQADAEGWAAVPVAATTQFDVRAAETYAPFVVRRFDEPATLIVALP